MPKSNPLAVVMAKTNAITVQSTPKSLTHASLPEIGRSFGGKHHSTVIHSIKKIDELRKKDGDFNSLITNFLASLR